MECIKFWCNFINERLYNSVDFHGFQEKLLKNPEALFQKHFFYFIFLPLLLQLNDLYEDSNLQRES